MGTGAALDYLVTIGGRLGLMCPCGIERGVEAGMGAGQEAFRIDFLNRIKKKKTSK